MGQVVVFTEPGRLAIEEVADRPLAAHEVRLRTRYSGISAGTELTAYRGANPHLHKRWDATQRLFTTEAVASLEYPIAGYGYEECGEVIELGAAVTQLRAGDLVCGTWGHRTHAILAADLAARRLLPAGLAPILGIYSHMGAIALNGVLDAAIRIGETVAVFGLGVPGQIVAQLARRSGAQVIGVEPLALRRRLAQELGAVDAVLAPADGAVAERIRALTGGRGADVCIEAAGAYPALHEAVRAAAYSARVVTLGFFQGAAQGLFLGEEFHHNRINLVCSQISGVSPELQHRWDRERLVQTALRLQAEGVLHLRPLITHTLPFAAAAAAFRLCDEAPEQVLQVVLDCTI